MCHYPDKGLEHLIVENWGTALGRFFPFTVDFWTSAGYRTLSRSFTPIIKIPRQFPPSQRFMLDFR